MDIWGLKTFSLLEEMFVEKAGKQRKSANLGMKYHSALCSHGTSECSGMLTVADLLKVYEDL